MNSKVPFFSIIIPTYNRASTIGRTLKSIAEQTFDSYEVIIVNDGSTDATAQVVASFLVDPRFIYYPKENSERAVARNVGIERAKGSFITFLDSDDGYYSNCLAEASLFLQGYPEAQFFHIGYEVKDETGKTLYRSDHREKQLNQKLLSGNFLSCINVFVQRDLLLKDQFNEDRALIGSEDYELWLRLAAKYPLWYHPSIGGYMLQHPMRSVVNIDKAKFDARMKVLLALVENNPSVKNAYSPQGLEVFSTHTLLYWSLHLAMAGYKSDAVRILGKALAQSPSLLASRKFLGIMKTLLLK